MNPSPPVAAGLLLVAMLTSSSAFGQTGEFALKSGESKELRPIFFVLRTDTCRTLLDKIESFEVLEAPDNLTVSMQEGMVNPPNCGKTKLNGAVVTASARNVTAPVKGKLVYRARLKTKEGNRLASYSYDVELKP